MLIMANCYSIKAIKKNVICCWETINFGLKNGSLHCIGTQHVNSFSITGLLVCFILHLALNTTAERFPCRDSFYSLGLMDRSPTTL